MLLSAVPHPTIDIIMKVEGEEGESMKVKDVMTADVVSVSARCSLQEALEIMRDKGLRRLPVIEGDELVGIIVQHDIEKALRRPGTIYETPVEWVMTRPPLQVIGPEQDVVEAAQRMIDTKVSCLPVMENDRVVGIISETDILNLFIRVMRGKD